LVVSGSFDVSDGLSVIPRLASEVTPMLRTLFSFIALLELLYGIPFGQQESLNNSTKSIMSIRPKENVKSELRRLKLEQQHIQRRVREILSVEFFKLDFLSHNFLLKRNSFLLISTYVKKSTEIDFQIRFGIDTD